MANIFEGLPGYMCTLMGGRSNISRFGKKLKNDIIKKSNIILMNQRIQLSVYFG